MGDVERRDATELGNERHFVAGREEVEAAGGQVLTLALEPGYSTTNLVERILNLT